jgi:hypothetical protein
MKDVGVHQFIHDCFRAFRIDIQEGDGGVVAVKAV